MSDVVSEVTSGARQVEVSGQSVAEIKRAVETMQPDEKVRLDVEHWNYVTTIARSDDGLYSDGLRGGFDAIGMVDLVCGEIARRWSGGRIRPKVATVDGSRLDIRTALLDSPTGSDLRLHVAGVGIAIDIVRHADGTFTWDGGRGELDEAVSCVRRRVIERRREQVRDAMPGRCDMTAGDLFVHPEHGIGRVREAAAHGAWIESGPTLSGRWYDSGELDAWRPLPALDSIPRTVTT